LTHHHLLQSFLIKLRSVLILAFVNTTSFVVSFGSKSAFIDFLAIDFCDKSLVNVLLLLNIVVIFFFELLFIVLVPLLKFLISLFHLKKHLFLVFFSLSFKSLNSLMLQFCFSLFGFSLLQGHNLVNSLVKWDLIAWGVGPLGYGCLIF
jgi:hypothetical protein